MLRGRPLDLDPASRQLYERFVPPNHPLRQLDAAVDFSFVLPLVADRYNPWIGRPAEHPERLWRLLFAQYYLNLSDRKVCLAAHESLALRWFLRLNAGESPPHPSTLQKFRFGRLDEGVYLRIHFRLLEQASEQGLLSREERQIYDTSHVQSNTRVSSVPALLLEARARVVKEVAKVDAAFGEELAAEAAVDRAAYRAERDRRRELDLPKPTKEEKIQRAVGAVVRTLVAVRARIRAGQLEPTERVNVALALLGKVVADRADGATERVVSVHDVEARKGKKGERRWDGRKLAVCVQEGSRLVTAALVAPGNRTDDQLLVPLLDQQEERFGLVPPELSADRALDSAAVREQLQGRRIVAHIPLEPIRNTHGPGLFGADAFAFDPFAGTLTCPAGRVSRSAKRYTFQGKDGYYFEFSIPGCRACALRDKCQPPGAHKRGRQVYVSLRRHLHADAEAHNATPEFQEAYGRRRRVEAKIWELVHHGARRCRYRGDDRSSCQLLTTVAVVNAKRLVVLLAARARASPGTQPLPNAA